MKRTDEWSVPYHGWGDEPMGAAGGGGALAIYICMYGSNMHALGPRRQDALAR